MACISAINDVEAARLHILAEASLVALEGDPVVFIAEDGVGFLVDLAVDSKNGHLKSRLCFPDVLATDGADCFF